MEIKWEIIDAKRNIDSGKIINVSYLVICKEDKHRSQKFGSIDLDEPEDIGNMIPFEDLTPEIIEGWVKTKLGGEMVTNIETEVSDKLEAKKIKLSTKTQVNGLPW